MATNTYDDYRKKQRDALYDDYERGAAALRQQTNDAIQADHLTIDTKAKTKTDELKTDQQSAKANAQSTVDKAAVQRIVDEQNAEERMSAIGLSHSGVRDTAIRGAANQQAVTERTAATALKRTLAAIDREIATVQSTAEADKTAVNLKRWSTYAKDDAALWNSIMKRADSNAMSLYKADLSAETARYKADASAAAAIYKADVSAANVTSKTIARIDAALRKKTNGEYGLAMNGSVVALTGGN